MSDPFGQRLTDLVRQIYPDLDPHILGSQIFDYWRSPFQQIHEHQTDGDVFDNTVPPQIVDITQDGDPQNPEMGPSQWGPAINLQTFGDKRGV